MSALASRCIPGKPSVPHIAGIVLNGRQNSFSLMHGLGSVTAIVKTYVALILIKRVSLRRMTWRGLSARCLATGQGAGKARALMRIVLFALLPFLTPALTASAQDVVPPEVVQLKSVHVDGDLKTVNVGNEKQGIFSNLQRESCRLRHAKGGKGLLVV